MTDNEIIKALECCYSNYCNECPCFGDDDFCMFKMQQQAVDLINRQKANIEKLNKRIKGQKHALFEQQSYTAGLQVEIKNLQADKEALIAGQETLQKCIAEKMAEIERLQGVQIQYVRAYFEEFVKRLKRDCSLAVLDTSLLNEVIDDLVEAMEVDFTNVIDFTDLIKVEAIKEFAERLKEKYKNHFNDSYRLIYDTIDNLVKEMTEGK